MLDVLHRLVNEVVPIVGMCDNGDGTFRIDYADEPTLEQVAAAEQVVASWPETLSRMSQQRELDEWFASQQAAGFTTPAGWKLGLRESDVILLTGAFVLAKEAAALDLGVPPIIDADGTPHSLTIQELTAVMLGYGQHRAALSGEYAARKAAI